ncbi:MAG: hypothetical protein FWE31_04400 [Firmicutes bacterium]|nr:hypothetical protein [Bacillota bacterium]
MKKQIIFMSVTTLACLFLVFSYGIAIFGFLFPAPMVGFMDSMGADRAALMFSERRFVQNDSDTNLLDALDRNISMQRHTRVIELTEELIERRLEDAHDRVEVLAGISGTIHIAYVQALLHAGRYTGEDGVEGIVYDILHYPQLGRPAFVYHLYVYQTSADTQHLHNKFRWYIDQYDALLVAEKEEDEPNQAHIALAEIFLTLARGTVTWRD